MSWFEDEPRPCDRLWPHHRHQYVTDPASPVVWQCPGHDGASRSLAELLWRRPDLADLTAAATQQCNEVMAA